MRVAAVLTGGICYALALPPFDLAAFGWLTLVPLLLAIRGEPAGSAFCYGALLGYISGWAVTWCFADAAARYFQLSLPLAVVGVSLWYLVVCGVPFGLFAAASAVILRSYRFRSARTVHRTRDRKSTRLNSSHDQISYAVFCLKKTNTVS